VKNPGNGIPQYAPYDREGGRPRSEYTESAYIKFKPDWKGGGGVYNCAARYRLVPTGTQLCIGLDMQVGAEADHTCTVTITAATIAHIYWDPPAPVSKRRE
jgi:hypothetical protein